MLEIKNLKKSYIMGREKIPVLNDISFKVNQGTFMALLGPSGCGKSTLLNILGGLDDFNEGEVVVNGENLTSYYKERKGTKLEKYRLENIGTIFQSFNLISHMTALQNVEVPMKLAGLSKQEMRSRATELLEKVGLEDRLNYKPSQLSGGQKQRVAIARALALNPNIILADEPTGALDSKTSEQIMKLLKEISAENGTTVIMVTHDNEIANLADEIIYMKDGEIIDEKVKEQREIKKTKKENKRKNMSFSTSVKHAAQAMFQKKWRNLLVSIGGSIGIAGIALIVGLGMGIEDKAKDMISGFIQENAITVSKEDDSPITYEESQEISKIEEVDKVNNSYSFTIPTENQSFPLAGGTVSSFSTEQTENKMMETFLVEGEFPDEKTEIALDQAAAERFLEEGEKPKDLIGKTIETSLAGLEYDISSGFVPFQVTGETIEASFVVSGITIAGESYISIEYGEELSKESYEGEPKPIATVVTANTVEEVESIKAKVEEMELKAISNEDILNEISKISLIIQVGLGAFAGVSLIVSTIMIGIVLYISVIERVKEIGILRAIGARKKDIRRIFLTEAALIGFFSATIGLLISGVGVLLGNLIVSNLLGEDSFNAFTLPLSLIVFCLTFSIILSMFAGIIPARKATKLNPVEALRHE